MTGAPSRPGSSIASVVTLALVIVITVLLGIAGVIAYRSVYETRWEDLHKGHRTLADQLAVGFASPLWNFDRPTIGKIAEGAFHEENISGLIVLAEDGTVVHVRSRDPQAWDRILERDPVGESDIVETRPILFEGEPIGRLKVMATKRFVQRDLRATQSHVVLGIAGLDLAVILSLYVLLHRVILRPLKRIEEYAVAVSAGGRSDPQEPLRGELGVLQKSILEMIRQLDARYTALEQGRAELKQANTELARSNAELQEFAYVASHDLQEPLRAVAGCVELLQERVHGMLDAKGEELITHTVEGTFRMQTLIEDLLALSRVVTRAGPAAATDSDKVLQQALANLSVAIKESGAEVTHDVLPTLTVDPTQLLQLFQNLISNAIKFRGKEPPKVHVSAARDGAAWRFSVKDNGIGIEPQYFERIFRIFQRLHTRREYEGNGIGLAVCKKIVERHGGRIGLESALGRGSTFSFTIPDPPPGSAPRSD
jgi:signal transduction histidine kinase